MTIVQLPFYSRWIFDRQIFMIWLITGFALSFSFYHEIVGHGELCSLCKWQRILFFIIFCLSPIGFYHSLNQLTRAFISLLFLGGFTLAVYHSLVQFGFLEDRCVVAKEIENMTEFMALLEQPITACSKISWKLFGLSASIYSALFSFIVLICLNFNNLSKLRLTYGKSN